MHEGGGRTAGRIHVVDVVALVLAAAAAVVAFTYFFRHAPLPAVVDAILGTEVEIEFRPDKPWKADFPKTGGSVLLEDYLAAEVVDARTEGDVRRVRLRVLGRELQRPDALTLFRTGVRRGSVLRISDADDEVRAEVVEVTKAATLR